MSATRCKEAELRPGDRIEHSRGAKARGERVCYLAEVALSALERGVLDELRARLVARFGTRLVRLVLFGSRARGEGHDESDLDVLVLVRGLSRDERRAALDDAGELETASGLVLSPLVRDADAWRDDTPLGRAIAREGVAA